MPRFHFDFVDGVLEPDHKGHCLDDIAAARSMAVRTLGQHLVDQPAGLCVEGTLAIQVTDADRLPLFTIRASAERRPATRRRLG